MIVSFVYPYLDHAARGDELRWSLRSLSNITGCTPMPMVFGRAPDWYRGQSIRLVENGTRERDVQSKILQACFRDNITERFVVVSDDTVFSQPISIDEVMTARHRGSAYQQQDIDRISGSPWHETRKATLQLCLDRGFSVFDTSTHWPWTFEKQKLLQLFSEFDMVSSRFLIEVLYANRYEVQVKPNRNMAYIRKNQTAEYWGKTLNVNQVVNWSDAMFDQELRSALLAHFPTASVWEKVIGEGVTLDSLKQTIVVAREACVHLGDPVRFEKSPFDGLMHPVFSCALHGQCVLQRINTKPYRRCIACPDSSLTSREVKIERPPSIEKGTVQFPETTLKPLKAELLAAEDDLSCRHREGIAYTLETGSRPCVKRPVTVWHCTLHKECTLRTESCLGGRVRGCSTCQDLSAPEVVPANLVQINANSQNRQG